MKLNVSVQQEQISIWGKPCHANTRDSKGELLGGWFEFTVPIVPFKTPIIPAGGVGFQRHQHFPSQRYFSLVHSVLNVAHFRVVELIFRPDRREVGGVFFGQGPNRHGRADNCAGNHGNDGGADGKREQAIFGTPSDNLGGKPKGPCFHFCPGEEFAKVIGKIGRRHIAVSRVLLKTFKAYINQIHR